MSFSDELIKVLDYLCEKIGIAVDWTSAQVSDNILPYVQEVVHRYTVYAIIRNSVDLLLGLFMTVVGVMLLMKVIGEYQHTLSEKEETFWFDVYKGLFGSGTTIKFKRPAGSALAFGIIGGVVGLVLSYASIVSIIKWSVVPEMQILETIKDMLN